MKRYFVGGALLALAVWFVFVRRAGSNLGGMPPTTIWQDIKSGRLHLPRL